MTAATSTSTSTSTSHRQGQRPLESLVKDKPSQRLITELSLQLRRGQLRGPQPVAEATCKLLRSVASAAKFTSLQELIDIIKRVGRELQSAQPQERVVGNITRRVVHLLREEAKIAINEAEAVALGDGNGDGGSASALADSVASLQLAPHAHHHQYPSSASSSASASASARPGPTPLRRDSAFVHGSFSISDLVAAGAMANSSSNITTPADTPATLSRSGSGFFNQSAGPASFHAQHASELSVIEDPDGEALAEAQDAQLDDNHTASDSDSDSDHDDERVPRAGAGAGAYWLKPVVVQAIQEMLDELEAVSENISKDARDHIHSGEVILTLGHSRTAESFFRAAAKDRKFTVIVAETAPLYTGHALARALSAAGISTLLIPDSSVFAVLPRVSKVVIGAHAILANGGLLSYPGSSSTALAARAHTTPIVVLAGTFKICPEWASLESGITSEAPAGPAQLLDPATAPSIAQQAELVNPMWDYVQPELVDVFITNVGEHPPSYVYRLVKENYDVADLVL